MVNEVRNMLPRLKLSDRITWAVLLWIFFNLFWLRFLEMYIPQWVGAAIATILAVVFVNFWPREEDQIEDEDEDEIISEEEEMEGE